MPTRLIQLESHASGSAALQVTGPNAERLAAEDVELSIVQPGQVDLYLDPRNPDHAWSTAVFRFRPLNPRREGAALLLDIDYGVTYHLRANQPYKLKIRQGDGAEIEERFTGSANLRRPTTIPRDWTPPPDPRGPVSPPKPVEVAPPKPEPVLADPAPTPDLTGEAANTGDTTVEATTLPGSATDKESGKRPEEAEKTVVVDPLVTPVAPKRSKSWLALAAALLLLIGGAAWWYLNRDAQDQPPAAAEQPDESLDGIRRFLASNPEPGAAREKAEALAASGKLLDGQFLLFKYAAERGDVKAARVMGTFYDPHTWTRDKSPLPAPNPLEAARWHKLAAEAGDPEAQYRYGMLLKDGGTDEPNGPEMAVAWLRKAAEQGNAEAKKALGQ